MIQTTQPFVKQRDSLRGHPERVSRARDGRAGGEGQAVRPVAIARKVGGELASVVPARLRARAWIERAYWPRFQILRLTIASCAPSRWNSSQQDVPLKNQRADADP